MDDTDPRQDPETEAVPVYEPPRFEVVSLGCEINAYAPAEEDPLH